jgi:GNAT superfamily N-acetyltransferase
MSQRKPVKKRRSNKKSKKQQKGGNNLTGVTFEEYEGFQDDDYGLELYDQLVEKGKAKEICRGTIGKNYIRNTFERDDALGYIAEKNGKYIGFIIYYKKNDHIYLDLICTKEGYKGLGQELIKKMEKYAKDNRINTIKADAVTPSLQFYKKNGWKIIGDKKNDKTPIEKSMVKKAGKKISPAKKKSPPKKKLPAKKKLGKKKKKEEFNLVKNLKKLFGIK